MTDYLDERELLEPAVSSLSTYAATHVPKAVLSTLRLMARFPALPPDHWREAWRRAGLDSLPRALGLFAESVNVPEGSGLCESRHAHVLAGRGQLALAHVAFHAWVAEAGFEAVVLAYRTRAAVEPGYLGHGFSIWCSFLEVAVLLGHHPDLIPWATERFCEFVSKAFPGYPHDDPAWQPPEAGVPPEITREELMAAALSRPGFFGHALLSLAALVRHGARLTREEWRAQAWAQLQATSRRYPDREDHERLPIGAKGFDSLEELVTRLTHSARDDVHALTLADAICTLWHNFPSPDVRVRLAAIGAHFAKLPAPPPA